MTNKYYELKNKRKYQNIFEHMPIGIIYFDTKGIVTDNNSSARQIFGRTKEEFIGLNLLKNLKDQKLLQAVRDVLTHGEAVYEDYYQPLNGSTPAYLQITFQAIYNDIGVIIAAVALVKNITEEKKAQIALAQYKHILDSTHDMLAYVDNQYRYLAVNKAYAQFHLIANDSISNKKVSDIVGEENFSHFKPLLDRALEGERFTVKGSYQHPSTEDTIYDVIEEEGTFAPHLNAQGDIAGVVIAIRDITTQELIKKKAHQEAARTRHYFDIVPVIILALDKNANIIRINQKACEILGYMQEELLGKNWIDTCIPQAIQSDIHNVFSDVMEMNIQHPQQHENNVVTKNGQLRTIAWNNILIKDDDGKVVEILSSGEEVTK